MYKIACVVGTRPEAIKMAPLIRLLKEDGPFAVTVLASGQHTMIFTFNDLNIKYISFPISISKDSYELFITRPPFR